MPLTRCCHRLPRHSSCRTLQSQGAASAELGRGCGFRIQRNSLPRVWRGKLAGQLSWRAFRQVRRGLRVGDRGRRTRSGARGHKVGGRCVATYLPGSHPGRSWSMTSPRCRNLPTRGAASPAPLRTLRVCVVHVTPPRYFRALDHAHGPPTLLSHVALKLPPVSVMSQGAPPDFGTHSAPTGWKTAGRHIYYDLKLPERQAKNPAQRSSWGNQTATSQPTRSLSDRRKYIPYSSLR